MIGTAAVTALLSSVASRVHADAPQTQAQDPVGIFDADLAPDSTAPPININAATQYSELDDAGASLQQSMPVALNYIKCYAEKATNAWPRQGTQQNKEHLQVTQLIFNWHN